MKCFFRVKFQIKNLCAVIGFCNKLFPVRGKTEQILYAVEFVPGFPSVCVVQFAGVSGNYGERMVIKRKLYARAFVLVEPGRPVVLNIVNLNGKVCLVKFRVLDKFTKKGILCKI